MDIPEEDQIQQARRQAVQAIMRDASLSPQEKQRKIQQFMASGAQVQAPPPAPAPAPPAPSSPPATNYTMDIPDESNAQIAKRQAIQQIMRDTSLTPQEKQRKIQQFMASGAQVQVPPPVPAPAPPPAPSPPPDTNYTMDIPDESNAQIAKRQAIQQIMRDTSLTPQEKQQRIQQYMARGAPVSASNSPPPRPPPPPPPQQRQEQSFPEPSAHGPFIPRGPSVAEDHQTPPTQPGNNAPQTRMGPGPRRSSRQSRSSGMSDEDIMAKNRARRSVGMMSGPGVVNVNNDASQGYSGRGGRSGESDMDPGAAPPQSRRGGPGPASVSSEGANPVEQPNMGLGPRRSSRMGRHSAAGGLSEQDAIAKSRVRRSVGMSSSPGAVSEPPPRQQLQHASAQEPSPAPTPSPHVGNSQPGATNPNLDRFEEEALAKNRARRSVQVAIQPGAMDVSNPPPSQQVHQGTNQIADRDAQDAMAKNLARGPVTLAGPGPGLATAAGQEPPHPNSQNGSSGANQDAQDAIAKSRARRSVAISGPGAVPVAPPNEPPQHQQSSPTRTSRASGAVDQMDEDAMAKARAAGRSTSFVGGARPGALQVQDIAPEEPKQPNMTSNAPSSTAMGLSEQDALAKQQAVGGVSRASVGIAGAAGATSNSQMDQDAQIKAQARSSRITQFAAVPAEPPSSDNVMDDKASARQNPWARPPAPTNNDNNPAPTPDYSGTTGPSNHVEERSTPPSTQLDHAPQLVSHGPSDSMPPIPTNQEQPTEAVQMSSAPAEVNNVAREAPQPQAVTSSYAGLHYNPSEIAGGETGGIQAELADTSVVATGVQAVASEEEQLAEQERKRKKYICYGSVCLLIVIIAIVVPVVVVVTKPAGVVELGPTATPSAAPSSMPTPAPTSQSFANLLGSLQNFYNDDMAFMEAFGDMESPQYRAAQWVANEDPLSLSLDDPRTLTRYTLATFYFSTNGDGWEACSRNSVQCSEKEWLSEENECDWFAVSCADDGTVDRLFFPPNAARGWNLDGSIPNEIGFLTGITSFIISNDVTSGTIPQGFDRLSNLRTVIISNNNFYGTFPSVLLDDKPNLNRLYIGLNNFNGTLPTDWSNAGPVTELLMSQNNFDGEIPPGISSLSNLRTIELQRNNLEGPIPMEIYDMESLVDINLNSNPLLTGTLSSDVSKLSQLTSLSLQNTGIGGELPESIYSMSSLQMLHLGGSKFEGTLSESFVNLTAMTEIILYNNNFAGPIPEAFDFLTNLNQLQLHGNQLYGNISQVLCDSKGDAFFDLRNLTADCAGDMPMVSCTCCDICF